MIWLRSCLLMLLCCFTGRASAAFRRGSGDSLVFRLQTNLDSDEILTAAAVDPCRSPAILTDLSGTLEYPAAGRYRSFKNCRWIIYARDPRSKIRIEFTFLNIEQDSPCDDYVQVFSMTHKPDSNGQHRATDFSGRLCPPTIDQLAKKVYEVDSPAVLIVFRSDWIFTARGFILDYKILSPPQPTTRISTQPTTSIITQPTSLTTQGTTETTTRISTQPTTSIITQPTSPTTQGTTETTATRPTRRITTTTTTSTTTPTTTLANVEPFDASRFSCDFENSGCAWINRPHTQVKFQVKRAWNSVWTNWLKEDHTKGSGQGSYAYLYTNQAQEGAEGALVSPELPPNPTSSRCLSFWYNMLQTTSSLVLSLVDDEGNKEEIFRRDGGQGKNWHLARVSLQGASPYFVDMSHSKGVYDVESGVAIDDISISDNPCPSTPQECGTTSFNSIINKAMTQKADWVEVPVSPGSEIPDFGTDQRTMAIIGGAASDRHQWPWVVMIKVFKEGIKSGRYSQCGGTLIDRQWIVTAAHCFESGMEVVDNPYNTLISFGEHDITESAELEFTLRPAKVYIHPDRASARKKGGLYAKQYDITLLKLKTPVDLTSRVNIACLPKAAFPPTTPCIAVGWGLDDSDEVNPVLQKLPKVIVSNDDCSYPLIEGMTCAKGQGFSDVCAGDSGGPLVCETGGKYELAGVVSFGDKCSARRHTSGVYSDVYHYRTWIQSTMNSVD